MAKKGKSDEKDQAEAGPLAGEPPVAETGGAPGVDAMVDGGGGAAADAGGTEQPDGAETPVLGTADTDMGEAAGAQLIDGAADAASEAGRPAAVSDAPADSAVSEGVSDAANVAGEIDGIDSARPNAVVVSQSDTCGDEQDGTGGTDDVFRDGDDVHAGTGLRSGTGEGEPDDRSDRESEDADPGDGSADGAASTTGTLEGVPDGPLLFPPVDGATDLRMAMLSAGFTAEYFAARQSYHFGDDMERESIFSSQAVSVLHDLVMRIGERATPDVMAQQLVIRKVRETADLTSAQRIGLQVFGTVACLLDARERQLLSAYRQALAPEERKPLPIEDTTLEPVSGPLDTW